MLLTIGSMIFAFGLLVFFHEFGHFITAKLVGMKVDEFAIGFGKKLLGFRYGETQYSLRVVPLGGFNKIAGMDSEEEQDERSFNSKPIWARIAVFFAGSGMNFVLPILLFTIVFYSSGIIQVSDTTLIGDILFGKAAQQAGLATGDKVVAINGKQITTWDELVQNIQASGDKHLKITYERNGGTFGTEVLPELEPNSNRWIIGIMPNISKYQPGILEAGSNAVKETKELMAKIIEGFYNILTGKTAAELAGPIGIAQITGKVAQNGLLPLLQLTAVLSINIGVFNLLPLPLLDGGHIVLLFIQALRGGRQFNDRIMRGIQYVGLVMLATLFLYAMYSDVLKLKI